MKLQIASDLHLEFHIDGGLTLLKELAQAKPDVLVLAGDITVEAQLPEVAAVVSDLFAETVYVHGNHEYYNSIFPKAFKATQEQEDKYSNFHWLNNDFVTLHNQRFYGGTMWFAPTNLDPQMMNDFQIPNFEKWYQKQESAFVENLQECNSEDIVISHHLPSWRSVHPKYAGSSLNRFFVNDLESQIKQLQPKLWIHGHTHESFDYHIDQTRIICNPFGYLRREENRNFNFELVLEI